MNLESEAKKVIEIAFARYEKTAVLFSGGKDSRVLLELVESVARSNNKEYDIVHIDTGENFSEILSYIKETVQELGRPFITKPVEKNKEMTLNRSQSFSLVQVISEKGYDVVFGGGRRDEDKARQKELFFSKRKNSGGWTLETSGAEIWPWLGLFKGNDEHFRVFPLNNWNEKDIIEYAFLKKIELCSLYYSHERLVVQDGNGKIALPCSGVSENALVKKHVRFRTVGDLTNSVPICSKAESLEEILLENSKLKTLERGTRLDDQFSEYSMEIRKKEGYF